MNHSSDNCERPSVPSKTPAQPLIPAEETGLWGICSLSKAKDFRVCYIAFVAPKLPRLTPAATTQMRIEMASTPCKGLKKDGTSCRGNGLEQLDGYCIAHAPADKAWHWRSHGGKSSPASRLPSCTQNFFARSLVNARVTLVYLSHERSYVRHPFNRRQKASSAARAGPPRPRRRRRPSPASRLPSCTQNFFAQSLVNARATLVHHSYERAYLCHPFNRRRKASSAARARPTRPRRRPSPATRLPSCTENFFAQPLVNSHETLVHLSYMRSCLCHPFNRRKKASSAARARPAATTPAPFASQPSAVMHRKLFCPISRPSLVNARHSLVPARTSATPSTAADRLPARPVPGPRRDADGLRLPPT